MPTILNTTVVASAYDTSGNGGRKLVQLSNGWLISAMVNANIIYFYKSIDNGNTWTQYHTITGTSATNVTTNVSITSKGNIVYALVGLYDNVSPAGRQYRVHTLDLVTSTNSSFILDSVTTITAVGLSSIAINDAGTELHASWSCKVNAYANSFNIRYAKGTIATDGSVAWSAVEQVISNNTSGQDYKNPSIQIVNGIPTIIAETTSIVITANGSANNLHSISILKRDNTLFTHSFLNSNWTSKAVYNTGGTAYPQSSPSAIFVPQSVNGLANGRIWVVWSGTDSTDIGQWNIRVSYSDDGGVTWSPMQKLTSGNVLSQQNVSITANKNNEVFILFQGNTNENYASDFRIKQIKNSGGTWGGIVEKKGAQSESPSALYDITLNFTEPLFIYKAVTGAKVGFYGIWTVFIPLANFTLPTNIYGKDTIDMMRVKTNEFRVANGLSAIVWTDPVIIKGVTPIKALHWNEINNGILEVYTSTTTVYVNVTTEQKIKEVIVSNKSQLDLHARISHIVNSLQNY